MGKIASTAALCAASVLALCGFAFQDAAAAGPEAPAADFGGINFTTYTGIALAVTLAVGFVKKLWKDWTKGKEIFLAYGLAVAVGAAAKAFGAFGGPDTGAESWVNHVIALVAAGAGSGLIHDKIVNPLKEKPSK